MSHKGEIKKVIRAVVKRGWAHEHGGKHTKVIHPDGALVSVSVSPSCPYAVDNIIKDINKILREKGEQPLNV